jgi:hypothetical protein
MSNSEGTRICFLQFGSAGMKTLQRGNTSELRLPLVGESDWGSRGGGRRTVAAMAECGGGAEAARAPPRPGQQADRVEGCGLPAKE